MLQVIRNAVLFLALCALPHFVNEVHAQQQRDVDWLYSDALAEDISPLLQTSVVLPKDYQAAMEFYKNGNYQIAIRTLENLRDLHLPDGRQDFVCFALGECYRMLAIKDLAVDQYNYIIKHFPQSDKVAPSYFRIVQYACADNDSLLADTIYSVFHSVYHASPLYPSVLYLMAKLRLSQDRVDETIEMASLISSQSRLYQAAQFLIGLCYIKKKEWDKSLLVLEYVQKNTTVPAVAVEAGMLIGDVYAGKGNPKIALDCYKKIPKSAQRYELSLVKIAKTYLDIKEYAKARDVAYSFMRQRKTSPYFFEMVSIVEQAYRKLKNDAEADRMKDVIFAQLKNARVVFDIYEEMSRVADMVRIWQGIQFLSVQRKDEAMGTQARQAMGQLDVLDKKYRKLLVDAGAVSEAKANDSIAGLSERRYLDILKNHEDRLYDSAALFQKKADSLSSRIAKNAKDTAASRADARNMDMLLACADSARSHAQDAHEEQAVVMKECLGDIQGRRDADENLQAKFVDWAIMKYQEEKTDLSLANKSKSAQTKKPQNAKDSVALQKSVLTKDQSPDVQRLSKLVTEDRVMLVAHINAMLRVYPKSRYIPQLLMRLSELYFDKASDDFDVKLRDYEQKMALAKVPADLYFPEYDMKDVIATYNRIIREFPRDELAGNAYFYKALALQKMGQFEDANNVFVELTNKYPESEFYVEACMNMARFYFEHPKYDNGNGYKLAEAAYKKVLPYRDHPQFVQALYSLGWCYYMQDHYEDAIAVFKYLVEEVALDFDVTKLDANKQVTNPLLRDEAIDYIAISFDEEGRMDDAVKFLQLIGSIDYAAMVLKRIAELRMEDMDYPATIKAYRRLLAEYPQSIVSPDAQTSLVKVYEIMNKPDTAFMERETFFNTYCHGGQWQELVWKRDSILIPRIDSMCISMGMYLADANFRSAEVKKDAAGYAAAARYYRALVDKYPTDRRASDALWNMAVILETKLNKLDDAFLPYVKFSKLKDADSARREQSALNAVAIAQKLMAADSVLTDQKIEGPALHLVEAVNNYRELFPLGKSGNAVQLSLASVYFNRKMYANAAEVYQQVVSRGTVNDEYWEAMFLLGQCHFGKENWNAAAEVFAKVVKECPDAVLQIKSRKFLLQAQFSNAKQLFTAGSFDKAAEAFLAVDAQYPGSEYGDVTLFKAAESYEKKEDWLKACDAYFKLQKEYPRSKFAPSALFNAAADFEKANKFDKAAESYESIISQYAESDKAKDALYNVAFEYEKLGKPDKMTEANDRFALLYPGEKDVEAMLLRSAKYYVKMNLADKAINAYRNFIRRYPQNPAVVEALFTIGKMYYDKQDKENAQLSFTQAQQTNEKLAQEKMANNDFFAAEAALYMANMKHDEFASVTFTLPDVKFKADQKRKSQLLAEAVKAYEKVLQYRSERMFEAAYRIGLMYEELTDTWKNQERPKLADVKLAVLEKDIAQASSALLQKSFTPYKKVIELAAAFDSLNQDQKAWVLKAKVGLAKNYFTAGQYLTNAIAAMQNAPVPPEIRSKPLYYYQYCKQVLDAIEPMKTQARTYFLAASKQLDSLGLKGENSAKCLASFCELNYLVGGDADKLADKILHEPEIPANATAAEREDLIFQFQDIVFELQDKAILLYEDAMSLLKKENLASGEWYNKILFSLARLAPDKYGKNVFVRAVVSSSQDWTVRTDSITGWNGKDIPASGWSQAKEVSSVKAAFGQSTAPYIWLDDTAGTDTSMYAWQHVYFDGQPRDAMAYIRVPGKYWLYINGTLTASDTVGHRDEKKLDSIVGITSLVKGGDNDINIRVINLDPMFKGCAIQFAALLDTTQHFKPSNKYPAHKAVVQTIAPVPVKIDTNRTGGVPEAEIQQTLRKAHDARSAAQHPKPATAAEEIPFDKQFKNHGELINAITLYENKAAKAEAEIKTQQQVIAQLIDKQHSLAEQIGIVKLEVEELKKNSTVAPK